MSAITEDPLVTLSVSGRFFVTTRDSLLRHGGGETFFAGLLSGRFPVTRDRGAIFIDRDPDLFADVLRALQYGSLPSRKPELLAELDFFGVREAFQAPRRGDSSVALTDADIRVLLSQESTRRALAAEQELRRVFAEHEATLGVLAECIFTGLRRAVNATGRAEFRLGPSERVFTPDGNPAVFSCLRIGRQVRERYLTDQARLNYDADRNSHRTSLDWGAYLENFLHNHPLPPQEAPRPPAENPSMFLLCDEVAHTSYPAIIAYLPAFMYSRHSLTVSLKEGHFVFRVHVRGRAQGSPANSVSANLYTNWTFEPTCVPSTTSGQSDAESDFAAELSPRTLLNIESYEHTCAIRCMEVIWAAEEQGPH
jgi:hypothetical protein